MKCAIRSPLFIPTDDVAKALLREEPTIRAAGFALRTGRTKSARFITFERIDPTHAVTG